MRMTLRTEDCRRRAALCAEKALCTQEEEPRRTFAELLSNGERSPNRRNT